MLRLARALCLLVLLSTFGSVWSATGVAFVHGTGKQTDALNDYWTSNMVNSVRQGLSNQANYVVINCDFEKYMWDSQAAGCLAGQLYNFINQRGINRPGDSDPLQWWQRDALDHVQSDLGQPLPDHHQQHPLGQCTGTVQPGHAVADAVMAGNVFEASLGWLLGYQSDAVRMQQTSWMQYYNGTWLNGTSGRPSLPKGFWNVVGSDVHAAVWNGASYCGGYQYQVGLAVTQWWLNSCSDGFLECSSQNGAGSLWFYDYQRTQSGRKLSHHQSRRNCFNLDVILRNDL